ncbi:MAG: DinB family protein [Nitrososphaerales archaeon]
MYRKTLIEVYQSRGDSAVASRATRCCVSDASARSSEKGNTRALVGETKEGERLFTLDYTQMFDYFKSERVKIVEAFEMLPYEEFAKNRELSFYSIKGTFLHTVDVEDNWLHRAYRGLPNSNFKPEEFKSLDNVKGFMSDVDKKTARLFKEITEGDLKKPVHRKLSSGKESTFSLEQVLYHIPIENIHHYGEIFAEFWKMNLDAPYFHT